MIQLIALRSEQENKSSTNGLGGEVATFASLQERQQIKINNNKIIFLQLPSLNY